MRPILKTSWHGRIDVAGAMNLPTLSAQNTPVTAAESRKTIYAAGVIY